MAGRSIGRIALVLYGILVLGVALASTTFFTVDAREFAVVTQFGRPVATHTQPGLYVKWPSPIQSVTRFDRRIQIYETPLIEYLTGDKKNIIVQAYACWRITDPLAFYGSLRTSEDAERRLDDIVSALIGSTLGDYKMSNLFSVSPGEVQVEKIEQRILEGANTRLKGADAKRKANYGIEFVALGFSRLALPDENARSVYRRMEAERGTIATQYRAEGQREAKRITSEAEREQSDILAEAYKQAEILRGQGEARAAQIYAEAYSRAPEFFDLIRTLDAYERILTENTTVILSADSDLFKYLNAKEPLGATMEIKADDVR